MHWRTAHSLGPQTPAPPQRAQSLGSSWACQACSGLGVGLLQPLLVSGRGGASGAARMGCKKGKDREVKGEERETDPAQQLLFEWSLKESMPGSRKECQQASVRTEKPFRFPLCGSLRCTLQGPGQLRTFSTNAELSAHP